MKKSALALFLSFGIISALSGSVIADHDTVLRAQPDSDAPIITILKAGTSYELTTAEDLPPNSPDLPTDWIAINYRGSFKGFVTNNNIRKDLSISPGASIYQSASSDAAIFTTMEIDDDAVFVSPEAGWSQIVIRKTIPLYINTSEEPNTSEESVFPTPLVEPELITPITAEIIIDQPEVQAMPIARPEPKETSDEITELPPARLFHGIFAKTKRFLGRKPKYDYRLLDSQEKTLLYLDVSTLLITDPLEKYLGRKINAFGTGRVPVKSKYLVIRVESLRLAE
ncbi:MAG: hypothetical protein JKY51_05445 [Opitutaceae bacterium]|nr:hypothetical protein [Opitutaceae bacterium]